MSWIKEDLSCSNNSCGSRRQLDLLAEAGVRAMDRGVGDQVGILRAARPRRGE